MFLTALFTIPQIWKQLKGPRIENSIKNYDTYTTCDICNTEYYSSIRKGKVLQHAAT